LSDYRAYVGHDVALSSLTVLSPQPHSAGIKASQRTYAASGAVYDQGLYVELEWDLLGKVATYTTVLTVFGLHNVLFANVTVYVRNRIFSYVRMNGVAVRPQPGPEVDWNIFPRNIKILVKDLVAAV